LSPWHRRSDNDNGAQTGLMSKVDGRWKLVGGFSLGPPSGA